jgi:hypothetical protein
MDERGEIGDLLVVDFMIEIHRGFTNEKTQSFLRAVLVRHRVTNEVLFNQRCSNATRRHKVIIVSVQINVYGCASILQGIVDESLASA